MTHTSSTPTLRNGAEQIIGMCIETALQCLAGTPPVRHAYFTAYIDRFANGSAALTTEQQQLLDEWIAGHGALLGLPFNPHDTGHRFVSFVGMASAGGDETTNIAVGRQRAEAVHGYLADRLGVSTVGDNIASQGSMMLRDPSDDAMNRAVEVTLEIAFRMPTPALSPPPPEPPEVAPPRSRDWSLGINSSANASYSGFQIGGQLVYGTLRNDRTGETRGFVMGIGGIELGASISPVDLAVNGDGPPVAFRTPEFVTFDDFDWTVAVYGGVSVAAGFEWSSGTLKFPVMRAEVMPDTLMIRSNVAIGVPLQVGIFNVLDPSDDDG